MDISSSYQKLSLFGDSREIAVQEMQITGESMQGLEWAAFMRKDNDICTRLIKMNPSSKAPGCVYVQNTKA